MPPARRVEDLELAGNLLCLDFANTINSRHRPIHDYLASYDDLLKWLEHAGSLGPGSSVRADLSRQAAVLGMAHRLRDAIHRTFAAIAAGRQPQAEHVERLGRAYGAATAAAHISRRGEAASGSPPVYELTWPAGHAAEAPLWPVARSAGDLLLTGDLRRIGECPGCGWLFLDVSRNGTRRWCNMATCGSRDKMARYHRRRAGRPA